MKRSRVTPWNVRPSLLATAVACCFAPTLAMANPTGGVVANGQATFSTQGKVFTVTNTPGAIINWQGFSIAAGETTRFLQQNSASAVLNRVVGGQTSSILGALQSNGRVFLINPSGIIFGSGARIDTAGLVASTLNIMDADFLTGKLRFGNTPGAKSIVNEGEIRTPAGGKVYLISPEGVTNNGIIHSPKGDVILAAGKSVEIVDSANPDVRIEVSAPEAQALNLGKIVAESGRIGIYGSLVTNRGLVNADSAVVGENGKIVFKASGSATLAAGSVTTASGPSGGSVEVSAGGTTLVAGDVAATGSAAAGGEVRLLGEKVGLIDAGRIDVSGERGGGTALVGGDLRGENPDVRNAQMTYVGADTQIKADAVTAGDGGKVVVWADDTTRSYGQISARGGQQSGNGGFVETSGKRVLDVQRGPDLRAPTGKGGTWLLDPNDVNIVAGGELDKTTNAGAPFFSPLADTSRIGVDLINAQLDFGSDVIINTTSQSGSAGTALGNITVSAPIVKTLSTVTTGEGTSTQLRLQAHNNIVIGSGGSITSTGDPLNVVLEGPKSGSSAGGTVTIGGNIATNGGSLSVSASGLTVQAGTQVSSRGATLAADTMDIQGVVSAGTGSIAVRPVTNGRAINLGGEAAGSLSLVQSEFDNLQTAGSFQIGNSSSGPVTVSGPIVTALPSSISVSSGSTITQNAAVTAAGPLSANANGAMTLGAPISAESLSVSAGATITQSAGANITVTDFLNVYANGAVALGAPISAGSLSVSAGGTLTQSAGANISVAGSLNAYVYGSGGISLGAPVSAQSISLTTNQALSQSAAAPVTATGDFTASARDITLGGTLNASRVNLTTDTLSLPAGGLVTSGSDIDVQTYSYYRPIDLGVSAHGTTPTSLELTAEELNTRLVTTAPTGVLRIGTTSSGPVTIKGAIAPSIQNLVLQSGASIGQDAGATITVPNLGLVVYYGDINLPEANAVSTLAAYQCCDPSAFTFANAPSTPLAIGTVDGYSGLYNYSYYGGSTGSSATLIADSLTIPSTAPISFYNGSVTVKPATPTSKVDLGGADAPGVMGLSAASLANVYADKLVVQADKADISQPIAPTGVNSLTIAPLTSGTSLAIVNTKTPAGAALEFTPGDVANVTAGTLILGNASTGPVTVNTQLDVAGTISSAFVLHSGDASTGITISPDAGLTAVNTIGLTADAMTIGAPVSSSGGSILISTNTPTNNIDLGIKPGGSLGLDATEIARLSVPAGGKIQFTTESGNIGVTGTVAFAASSTPGFANEVVLDAGGTASVGVSSSLSAGSVDSPSSITLRAPNINIDGPVNASGDVMLIGNAMNINSLVTASGGNMIVKPRDYRSIDLGGADTGSTLGLTQAELSNLQPTSLLRIGENTEGNTGDITISSPISMNSAITLSLKTGNGSVTQASGTTISAGSLAVHADGNIDLTQRNSIGTVAAQSWQGSVGIANAGSTPLSVGVVDNVYGIKTYGQDVSLRADQLSIGSSVDTYTYDYSKGGYYGGTVSIAPTTAGTPVVLLAGTKVGGALELLDGEIGMISAGALRIGDSASGNITVTAPINVPPGYYGYGTPTRLELTTAPGSSVTVNAPLTVPGDITVESDAMTFAAMVSSSSGNITLQPTVPVAALPATLIDVGGADLPAAPGTVPLPATLGLDATDLGNLSYGGGTLTIGRPEPGNMSVSHPGTLPGNVSLVSGGHISFDGNTDFPTVPFGAAQSMSITAGSMSIPSSAGITAGTGVNIAALGGDITLGTKPGAGLGLDTAELGKMSITGPGALTFVTNGMLKTTAPLAFTSVSDVTFNAGTIVHSGGALSAPGNIELRADSIPSAGFSSVTSTGGGQITIAPRSEYNSMTIGTTGSGLVVNPSVIGGIATTGTLQLGDATTGSLNVAAPLDASKFGALALIADSSITQALTAPITATNLRVETSDYSSVTLDANNVVGTLAGRTGDYGSFSFTNAGTLTVGTVGPTAGITTGYYGTVSLKADGINIVDGINTSYGTVTLAPRSAGAAIDLGGDSGFGLTNDEINRVWASTLNIGTNTATGSITVSAPVDRAGGGELNLVTAPGGTINVIAPLGTVNTSSISLEAGAGKTGGTISVGAAVGSSTAQNVSFATGSGGTVNIGGPVTAFYGIDVSADTISVTQPMTATYDYSSIRLENVGLNGSINIGGELKAGYEVSATGRTIAVNAPITSRYLYPYYNYTYGTVSLGASAGTTGSSVTVNQPVTAGQSISIQTDSVAINAALKTRDPAAASVYPTTVTLQPLTAGTPISLGTETAGAFSVSTAELAQIVTDSLTIGNTNAGPLTVNAPIDSVNTPTLTSTLQLLSLKSASDITQLATAPIELSYERPLETGGSMPYGTLYLESNRGSINFPAANKVNYAVTGYAGSGTGVSGKDFAFTSAIPLQLQHVNASASTGKVLVAAPAGKFVPPPAPLPPEPLPPEPLPPEPLPPEPTPPEPTPPAADIGAIVKAAEEAVAASVLEVSQAQETQQKADKEADARKEDEEKKAREEEKKEGKKACS